jgi:hypothetical protein
MVTFNMKSHLWILSMENSPNRTSISCRYIQTEIFCVNVYVCKSRDACSTYTHFTSNDFSYFYYQYTPCITSAIFSSLILQTLFPGGSFSLFFSLLCINGTRSAYIFSLFLRFVLQGGSFSLLLFSFFWGSYLYSRSSYPIVVLFFLTVGYSGVHSVHTFSLFSEESLYLEALSAKEESMTSSSPLEKHQSLT